MVEAGGKPAKQQGGHPLGTRGATQEGPSCPLRSVSGGDVEDGTSLLLTANPDWWLGEWETLCPGHLLPWSGAGWGPQPTPVQSQASRLPGLWGEMRPGSACCVTPGSQGLFLSSFLTAAACRLLGGRGNSRLYVGVSV